MSADWKMKYMEMRSKLKEATDVAYRLGYERGMKDGTQQAQMQSMQQQMQAQQQAMMGGQPGQPGAPGGDPSQDPGMQGGAPGMPPGADDGSQDPQMAAGAPEAGAEDAASGSELDNHINELQSLVAKGEKPSVVDIRKVVSALAGIRKSQKDTWSKKTEKTVSAQKKVVDSILKKWEEQAKQPSSGIEALIKEHGLKIEEE